jgi:hypothetical protein
MYEMNTKKSLGIANFEKEMNDFPKDIWQEQVNDLAAFINGILNETIEKFKKAVLEKFIVQKCKEFNQFCSLGFAIIKLKSSLDSKMTEAIRSMENAAPLLQGNISDIDRAFVTQSLKVHIAQLCQTQTDIEQDWSARETEFKQEIYSTNPEGIDEVIKKMLECHETRCQQLFAQYDIRPQPFFNNLTKIQQLKNDNVIRSSVVAQKCRTKCISDFNEKVGRIFSMNKTVPEKYGALLTAVDACLQQYYAQLPWPLNNDTMGEVHSVLQQQLVQSLNQLYTPAVQEQLKQDRLAQQQRLSQQRFERNESLLWVHCVGCRRIFAGRTRGCVKVTCSRFAVDQGLTTDHGCNLTFEWVKAQPVDLSLLPTEFWFSKIEAGERAGSARNIINDAFASARDLFAAKPKTLRKRTTSH